MVDSEFIIKYTNALYTSPAQASPSYEEFRDMFSHGQIQSKTWLAEELLKAHSNLTTFCISGAWFATLAFYLKKAFPKAHVTCIDIDPRCETFINILTSRSKDQDWLVAQTANMYDFTFEEDCIINTSCEHIENLQAWLKKIPSKRVVVLQSTNYKNAKDHVSTTNSIEEFHSQIGSGLKKILFSGEKNLDVYKRFMVIGET